MDLEAFNKPKLLALDVDQTLADGVVSVHLEIYNTELDLGMTKEGIQEAGKKYASTFDIPEIADYRLDNEDKFQIVRNKIRTSPEVHLALTKMPHSSVQVRRLLESYRIAGYYTVRPPEIEQATFDWLSDKNYPYPGLVVFCENPQDKVEKVVKHHLTGTGQRVILIDDGLSRLVEAATNLSRSFPDEIQRLILVGYGQTAEGTVYPDTGLRTITLPSWEEQSVDRLVWSLSELEG